MRTLLLVLLSISLSHAAETYLVCAGVERYDDPGISPLRYTVADVTAVAEVFRAAGVPDRNVTVLTTDQADPLQRPSASRILFALQMARERAVAGDTVVFMFSGHGMEKGDESYLLTVESNRALLERTALAMSSVNEMLRGLQASHLLLIIDACRNNPDAGKSETSAALDESFAKGMRPKMVADANGQIPQAALLLACDVGERAWEHPGEGHGAFTWALLSGLRGKAAEDDGAIRLNRLADYVSTEVRTWTARARRQQHPKLDNPGGADFVVLKPSERPAAPGQPTQPAPSPAPPSGGRPANWPSYLSSYQPPTGMGWSSYRVSPKDGMPQVLIPAREFLMGSPATEQGRGNDEGPQKRVSVSAFWMDLHEVTVGQYQVFCQATGRKVGTQWNCEDRHPVVMVSWDDASAYAAWAGRELPTEAQWEKAARGGTTTAYPWGDAFDAAKANNNRQGTTAVGSYPPNGFGLFDMSGNVWEWCRDWYDEGWHGRMPGQDPVNATQSSSHVFRGGSWDVGPSYLRAASRGRGGPGYRGTYLGFRCGSPAP